MDSFINDLSQKITGREYRPLLDELDDLGTVASERMLISIESLASDVRFLNKQLRDHIAASRHDIDGAESDLDANGSVNEGGILQYTGLALDMAAAKRGVLIPHLGRALEAGKVLIDEAN